MLSSIVETFFLLHRKTMQSVSEKILKGREACRRWKAKNREYYLKQQREASARPEYRARMRQRYAEKQQELKDAGILPRKMGRPRLYSPEEWVNVERERAREASARYRARRKNSLLYQNDEHTKTENSSEESDRSSHSSSHTTNCASIRHWVSDNDEWKI